MTKEEFRIMFPSMENYTLEMYEGNEPCGKGHELISGGFSDRWSCKFGFGETNNGEILHAEFNINNKITIFIQGCHLWILDLRYSGKNDIWEYTNDGCLRFPGGVCLCESHRHELEDERIKKILDSKIDSLFWGIVQRRTKELYEEESK